MSKWITPDVRDDAPDDRNLTQELNEIFAANQRFAPQSYALEAQYGPLYNRIQARELMESVRGFDDNGQHIPGQQELGREATAAQRNQDIGDVEHLGGRAVEAQLNANPYLRFALDDLRSRSGNTPLLAQLNSAAQQGLSANGELSPEDMRDIDQQTRGAFADRGMMMGNQAIGAELLNREAAKRARIAAAQQYAAGVQGLNQADNEFAGRVAQITASSLADPYMSVLNRPSISVGPQGNGRVFQPFDAQSYGQDLFNTNYNAGVNLAIQNSNAQAATRQAIATMASGFIGSDRRLKENIRRVGRSPGGIPIYEFNYRKSDDMPKGLPEGRHRGTIAQEVQEIRPDAVAKGTDGFLRVLYHKLDVRMERVTPLRVLRKAA